MGSGTSAFILARELQLRGHSVTVLTDASLRGNPEHKSLAFDVRYINDFEAFATGKAGFAAALDDLYKNIVTIKPDIIHACNFMPMFLLSIIKPLLCEFPIVFTFFNTPVLKKRVAGYFSNHLLDVQLGRFVIEQDVYDKTILGSKYYVAAAQSLGANPDKIRFSYLPPDIQPFLSNNSVKTDKAIVGEISPKALERPYIILPSRITAQKGIIEAVRALDIVNRKSTQRDGYNLLLTGMACPFDQKYADRVWDEIRALNLQDRIIVPASRIKREHLASFYRESKMVIIPSWYEGLGLSAIEAQVLGVVLAASDTVGLNEVVRDGFNGLTFSPRDSKSLADCILRIDQGEVDIDELTRNAKLSAKRFSIDRHLADIEACYREVLANKR